MVLIFHRVIDIKSTFYKIYILLPADCYFGSSGNSYYYR